MLSIEHGLDGDVVVAGRFDAAEAPGALAFLDSVGGIVRLDCSGLDYISSAGLGVLLKTQASRPSSGIMSPRWPSRHENWLKCETRM